MRKGNQLINDGRVPKRRTVSQQIINDVANGYYLDGIEAGYKAGYEDGYTVGGNDAKREISLSGEYERIYHRGLDDAWEVARKIFDPAERKFCDAGERDMYEYSCNVIGTYTASEAKAKIEAYEQKRKETELEIHVGDEVEVNAYGKCVVTIVDDGFVMVLLSDGSTDFISKNDVTKTGRHYDIQSILDQMRGKA